MPDAAVIFDVDGVLLDLTGPEEDAFFAPFERRYGLTGLSRDWDSYRIRNDEDIICEILERHLGRAPHRHEYEAVHDDYMAVLREGLASGSLRTETIPGTPELLRGLSEIGIGLGIATANVIGAARQRLEHAGLWNHVATYAHGADGGGAKRTVLTRAIDQLDLPRERIVYIGDNLNDVDAGLSNGVHFIGFAVEPHRRDRLAKAGATTLAGTHAETYAHIAQFLKLA
ncbi:MAG: HAD hydrolase-like protein [Hyphomicrobiales bacterium]